MNGNLTIIEAKEKTFRTETNEAINVCAYCRVSTDENDQRNSLNAQKSFFDSIFDSHKNWNNVGIFADEGISGTSLNKRDQFIKMINLAKRGKIDLIYTKEVSRFARNVKDLLNIVEELREKNVFVYFLTDEINTEADNFREKLSQVATNAEMESLKTSRRVKWGQAERMKQGVVFGRKEMFGYNIVKDENGKQHFEIIEEEANVVKMIFELFAEGYGTYKISKKLQELGIKTKRYKNGWSNTVILRILRNEKYVGDLKQGKTYTPDALTHKKKYNFNNAPMFEIKDHHPESAIVSRELWDTVQRILEEKAPNEETKAKHSNRYWCSGKVYCGVCGNRFISHIKKQKTGFYKSWVCYEHNLRGVEKIAIFNDEKVKIGCNSKPINEKILKQAVYDILMQIIIPNKNVILEEILEELKAKSTPKLNTKKITSINNKINKKEDELAELIIKYATHEIPEHHYRLASKILDDKINALNKEKKILEMEKESFADSKELYNNYKNQINEIMILANDEINEDLFEKILKRIIVYPNNLIEVFFTFLPYPICMNYKTKGKGATYSVEFTIVKT
ncbi:MAG: recombinase family protein [Clostridia bacterium]|nr:recombinase family protein [Clostridia bacterium]